MSTLIVAASRTLVPPHRRREDGHWGGPMVEVSEIAELAMSL